MTTVLTIAAVLITAVALALGWDRVRVIGRVALVAGAVLSVAATVGVQVNRISGAFPALDKSGISAYGSEIVEVPVSGHGMSVPMYVYLPAAYRNNPAERFPVIEALHGYPGTPKTWLGKLRVQATLDGEINAGRMAPTVVLFPTQTPQPMLDTECTDLRGGAQSETFLTVDVPAYARAHYRIRTDPAAWGLAGYSAGGYCAANLLLRHPGRYAAAASLAGYATPGIDVGDGSQLTTNNDVWRLRHLPQPAAALWVGWAADDRGSAAGSRHLAAAVHAPLALTTAMVAHGGHSSAVWRQMEAPAFDWLSAHLAGPLS
ncbi:esterase [Actinoplanes bogorensis]|uniref:Esterase n=1 Tax=Paractinoplanes bogorensis TaxID=1610840 RepID=A0ABS5Z4P8_9ACTN|nr:alpha/beta hydrolase-fold protein [Actinoplanes bogorensis]MBU2670662.1 esterase [Actinoplanes bogorensis]